MTNTKLEEGIKAIEGERLALSNIIRSINGAMGATDFKEPLIEDKERLEYRREGLAIALKILTEIKESE